MCLPVYNEPHYFIGLIVIVCQTWYFDLNVIICQFLGTWRYGNVDNYSLTVEPAFNDLSDQRPPAVYGHLTNVPTDINVNVPQISGHLPNADADSN